MFFETGKLDTVTPSIQNTKDRELIELKPGKAPQKNNYRLIFFKQNKAIVLKRKGEKIDYYIFPNKIQFKHFCERINNKEYCFEKKINGKPVYFLNDFLGVGEYESRRLFKNPANIIFILNELKKTLGYTLDYHKTIFSKAVYDAQKINYKEYFLKNEIDSFFGFVNNNAYKDVFLFKDIRKKRKIIVLDINSMYPFLLTKEKYPLPYTLEKKEVKTIEELEEYPFFLIRAKVKLKKSLNEKEKEFIKNFHGIECRIKNYTVPVNMDEENGIITYFFKEEYEFYKKYLDFELEDRVAIVSKDKTSASALEKKVRQIYPKRLSAKAKKKEDERYEIIDSVIKNYLVALPSAFSQNSSVIFEKYFRNEKDFNDFIKEKLALEPLSDMAGKPFSVLKKTTIKLKNKKEVLKVKYKAFSYRFPDNLLHHHGVMFANARILMLKYFEKLYSVKEEFDLEIAYSNIDSIHVSIDAGKYEEFKEFLKKENIVGEELGKLKVETEADYGVWFDVGTYYLFDKNFKILKFANPLPKEKKKPFQIVCAVKDVDEFGFEFYRKYNFFKSFRYVKPVKTENKDLIRFKRLSLKKGCSYEKMQEFVKSNLIELYDLYRETFYELKTKNEQLNKQ